MTKDSNSPRLVLAALATLAALGCRATSTPHDREQGLQRRIARQAGVVAKGQGAFSARVAEGAGIFIDNPGGSVRLIGVAESLPAPGQALDHFRVEPVCHAVGQCNPRCDASQNAPSRDAKSERTDSQVLRDIENSAMPGIVERGVGALPPNVSVSLRRFGFGATEQDAKDHLEIAVLETPRLNDDGWWVLKAQIPPTARLDRLIEHEQRVLAGDEVLPRVDLEVRVPPRVAVTVARALRIEAQGLGEQSLRRDHQESALRTEAPLTLNAFYGIRLRDCRATLVRAHTALGALEGVSVAAMLRCEGAQELIWTNGSGRKEIRGVSGAVTIAGGGGSVDIDAGGSLDVRTTLAGVAESHRAGQPEPVAFLRGEQPARTGDRDPEIAVRGHQFLASRLVSRHGAVLLAIPPESPITLDAFSRERNVVINLRAESIAGGGLGDDATDQSRVLAQLGQGPQRAVCIIEAAQDITVTAYNGSVIHGDDPRRSRAE